MATSDTEKIIFDKLDNHAEKIAEHGERLSRIETTGETIAKRLDELVIGVNKMVEEVSAMRPLLGLARIAGSSIVSALVGAAIAYILTTKG